ncbi:MAG: hypothetical protein HY852_19040 [Bradyrhizobium sp.]|uniref:hypothetical protein n=1 Tax=Bradyrhizobium sp. TaxID=376 RepID=UPI0025C4BF5B|nr:hypothetical protein [Bradyrhizobium sp.]MBI5263908.1 hypothetical protein [Bradyrhizobium sp.]
MSNTESIPSPPPSPPPAKRSGWVTALLLVIGIVLLLPGVLCAVISIDISTHMGGGFSPDPLTLGVALLAMGGTALIFFAILRGRASPP